MSEWQPIETAPLDGTRILVCAGKKIVTVRFWRGKWTVYGYDEIRWLGWLTGARQWLVLGSDMPPTHWMPLPKLPVQP